MVDIDEYIILKFLKRSYPITRVKYVKKFKRGIILNNTVYLIGNESSRIQLRFKLIDKLNIIFGCSKDKSDVILNKFLNIKNKI